MKPAEDAPWRLRTGLLPAGDPLASALEELAGRPRTHRLRAVGLIDVATGGVGPPCDLEVVDGRIVGRAPTLSTNGRAAPCQWFAAPGFVDAHAHVSSVGDLVGLLVYGVTAFRQMWGEPAHRYTAGGHRARTAVLPRPWVATAVIDGPGSHVPTAAVIVADSRAVRHVMNEAVGFGFDGIKVYDDLELPLFTEIVQAAEQVGLPVVGHVPERVPLDMAQRSMWSTEHLYGVVPNVFRLPPAQRWPALAEALDRAEDGIHALAASFAGYFVCPTLTAWRALTGERRYTRPSSAAIQLVDAGRRRAWSIAARKILGTDRAAAQERGAMVDRLGRIARVLAENGARLLVGTDCGNPFVLAGPSYHKELAELSRAGLGLGAVLRAATTEAHEVMRWSESDTDEANLVLYRRPPVDVGVFARPDSVLVDGVLLDGDDLDHLWGMRLAAAGLDADVWPRGELNPSVPGIQRERERAGAG